MSDFPSKLAQLRRQRGLTIRDIAAALAVGVGTVGGWLKDYRPRPEVAKRLADYLGVTVDILLDDAKELPISAEQQIEAALRTLPAPIADPIRADVQAHLAAFDTKIAEKLAALDARIATLDAALTAMPGVADALAAGLTIDEVRAMIRAEIARRRSKGKGQLSPVHAQILREEHAAERRKELRAKRAQSSPAKAQGAAGR